MSQSFYSRVPEAPKEDYLRSYLDALERRNGTLDPTQPYGHREKWVAEADGARVRYPETFDPDLFEKYYAHFDARAEVSDQFLALLLMIKMNAGEAYGVEVTTRVRYKGPTPSELVPRLNRILVAEERYHSRILTGAVYQFGLTPPKTDWTPPLGIRAFFHGLSSSPDIWFNPMLLAGELHGAFQFQWMLRTVGRVFKDNAELRDLLQARIIEILVDEIGHVAFFRALVGRRGMAVARWFAGQMHTANGLFFSELPRLGWGSSTAAEQQKFDYLSLPEEVRRRAFFI